MNIKTSFMLILGICLEMSIAWDMNKTSNKIEKAPKGSQCKPLAQNGKCSKNNFDNRLPPSLTKLSPIISI